MLIRPGTSARREDKLLLLLPLVVLIVPQGTITRSFIPEIIFAAFLLIFGLRRCLLSASKGQFLSFPKSKINYPLLILLVYFLLVNPLLSFLVGNDVYRILLTALPFVLLVVYYLISMQALGVIQTRRLIMVFGLSGVVISTVVIGNHFLSDISANMRSTMITGRQTLTLPLIPMAGVLFISLALTTRYTRAMLVFILLATICVVAILMTVTRAMMLAYGGGLFIVLWLLIISKATHHQRRRALLRLGYLATAFVILTPPFVAPWLSRLDPVNERNFATILGRFDEYSAFLEGFYHSPIFGQGLGHRFTYPSDFDLMLSILGITVPHSHFFFLAGTTGFIGMLLYYAVMGDGIVRHWKISKKIWRNDDSKGYVIGMLGAAVAGFLFTLSSTTFTTLSYNLFLAIFLYTSRLDWGTQ